MFVGPRNVCDQSPFHPLATSHHHHSLDNSDQHQIEHTSNAAALFANNLLIRLGSSLILPNDLFDIYFHPTCGSKVTLSQCSTVALRDPDSYHNGLVFINSPLLCNTTYLFTIAEKSERCLGNLRLGVTDLNPKTLAEKPNPWPADSIDFACARETEFWDVRQVVQTCNIGDVVAVFVTKLSKRTNQRVVMYNIIRPKRVSAVCTEDANQRNSGWTKLCDVTPSTGQLWLLIDLFGKTNSVALIG